MELPAGAGAGEMALHIPICLQAAGETLHAPVLSVVGTYVNLLLSGDDTYSVCHKCFSLFQIL